MREWPSLTEHSLNVAVVGCGFIANSVHLPLLTSFRDVRTAAVCDSDKKRVLQASENFRIPKAYTDIDLMLEHEKLDLVDICTPPQTHGDVLKRCLERGYPCMVEKPLTATLREANEVVKLSREKGLGLFVLHTYSYLPCFRKAKQIFANGLLGSLATVGIKYLVPLKAERYMEKDHWAHKLPAGILSSEITPHLLMLLLEFLGHVEKEKVFVHKLSRIPHIAVDELRMILLADGRAGYLDLSYNSPVTVFTVELAGDRGYLFIDGNSEALIYHEADLTLVRRPFARGVWALSDIWQSTIGLATTTINVLLGRYKVAAEGHRFLMRECFRTLWGKSSYPVDIEKACEVVRLMEKVHDSVKLME